MVSIFISNASVENFVWKYTERSKAVKARTGPKATKFM